MADIPTKEAFCNTLGANGKPHGRLAAFTNEAYATGSYKGSPKRASRM